MRTDYDYDFTQNSKQSPPTNLYGNLRPPTTPKTQLSSMPMFMTQPSNKALQQPSTPGGGRSPFSVGNVPGLNYTGSTSSLGLPIMPGSAMGPRVQQSLVPTLGGLPLPLKQNNPSPLSPRSSMGTYGNTGVGMGGLAMASYKSNQIPASMQSPSRSVHSKTETKSDHPSRLVQAAGHVVGLDNYSHNNDGDYDYGSSYQPSPPKNVSLPRPYVPPPNSNPGGRTAGGMRVYNPSGSDFADPSHVPANGPRAKSALSCLEEEDSSVGPDRPTKALNDVWSACWDDEVKATYYYNHQTGEATWILPEGL